MSKKTLAFPGMGIEPVKLEVGWQTPPELSQARQKFRGGRLLFHGKMTGIRHLNLDVVAFGQAERLDHGRRQANRQTVTPFGYLHGFYLQVDIL